LGAQNRIFPLAVQLGPRAGQEGEKDNEGKTPGHAFYCPEPHRANLLNAKGVGKKIDTIRGGMNIAGQNYVFKAELGSIFENTSFPKADYANIPPSAGQARNEKRNAEP
jgi:hypothetical protein